MAGVSRLEWPWLGGSWRVLGVSKLSGDAAERFLVKIGYQIEPRLLPGNLIACKSFPRLPTSSWNNDHQIFIMEDLYSEKYWKASSRRQII